MYINVAACRPEDEFRCENGGCIDASKLCDYIPDCEGGEDEANCSTCGVFFGLILYYSS